MSKKYAGFYAKSREDYQKMRKPKATPLRHCIKSCILDNFGDCEKPSVGADALGMATSDNEMLCKLDMNAVCIKTLQSYVPSRWYKKDGIGEEGELYLEGWV